MAEEAQSERLMQAWGKIVSASKYAGVSPRSFREWLKQGLVHSRLPSGTVLVRFSDIDDFLKNFQVKEKNEVDHIVNDFFKMKSKSICKTQ